MGWRRGFLAGILVSAGVMMAPAVAVAQAPAISESFDPGLIPVDGAATLTFTISNQEPTDSGFAFRDVLPPGLTLGSVSSTNPGCPGGNVSSNGAGELDFSAPILVTDPSSPCTFSVQVGGVEAGHWDNPVALTFNGGTGSTGTGDVFLDVAAPPTISAGFGTSLLGLDGTTSLTFTITNPNPTVILTGIGFTDTLPSGLVFSLPAGGSTCPAGTMGTVSPGSDSIAFSGAQLAPGASCTVSETVAATAVGIMTDTTTPVVSNEGRFGIPASATITVVGAPIVSLSSPVGGRRYAFGQKVRASFSCTDDPNGPGISSCAGTVPSGSLVPTAKAGAHTFTVTARSLDGGVAANTVFYTVAPSNRFRVGLAHVHPDGSIDFVLKLPGPGRIDVREMVVGSRAEFAHRRAVARRPGKLHLTIVPGATGRLTVHGRHSLRVTVAVAYTPRGGARRTIRFQVGIAA